MLPSILHEYYVGVVGGHSSFLRTYKRIIRDLYCVGMKRDIQKFVAECEICQQNKSLALSPAGFSTAPTYFRFDLGGCFHGFHRF